MGDKKKFSILIVDDSGPNLRLLANILKADYKLYIAKNGFQAIQTAAEKQPDVILLDILMPNIDGYEVIAVLKNDERTREIPVIFITALDNPEAEEKGLSLQAADYIGKPFNPAIVKLRVRNQIQMISHLREAKEMRYEELLEEAKKRPEPANQENALPAGAENGKLYCDPLTEIYNRQFFEEYIKSVISQLAESDGVLSLMMIDIDRFEQYSGGKQKGGECLKRVAGALKSCIFNEDEFVARYDERFVAVLPNVDKYGARLVARKMLHAIRGLDIPHKKSDIAEYVTVSIGVASGRVQHANSRDDYLELANDMLRASKNDGGNKYNLAILP